MKDSKLSIDFPITHSDVSISDDSSTAYPAHSSGYLHITFKASISDFAAFYQYWIHGYHDVPITIRLQLAELIDNKYQNCNYTIKSHVTVKTSNTIYGIVILDIGSLAAGGEGVKGVVAAAKAGQKGKSLWEAFKVLQGPIRKGVGWLDELLGGRENGGWFTHLSCSLLFPFCRPYNDLGDETLPNGPFAFGVLLNLCLVPLSHWGHTRHSRIRLITGTSSGLSLLHTVRRSIQEVFRER